MCGAGGRAGGVCAAARAGGRAGHAAGGVHRTAAGHRRSGAVDQSGQPSGYHAVRPVELPVARRYRAWP
ncbi:hypothetical protein G6F62_015674 [Rhizopus arrhizus]|nr:hypothetical protein G6F62_015674 [Rhizopus arrhizus]